MFPRVAGRDNFVVPAVKVNAIHFGFRPQLLNILYWNVLF